MSLLKAGLLHGSLCVLLCSLAAAPAFGLRPPASSDAGRDPAQPVSTAPRLDVQPALEFLAAGSEGARALPQLRRFFEEYSDQWEVRWDARSDRPHLVEGAGIPLLPGRANGLRWDAEGAGQDDPVTLAEVEARIRNLLARFPELFGLEGIDLRLDPESSFSFGDDQHLWLVVYQQYHDDLPVRDARAFFRITHGNVSQFGLSRVAGVTLDTVPTIRREAAIQQVYGLVGSTGERLVFENPGTLAIVLAGARGEEPMGSYAGPVGHGYRHLLAWTFLYREVTTDHPYRVLIDAHTGDVLERADLVVYDSSKKRVTGEVYPHSSADARTSVGFPFATVSNDGLKNTDARGYYDFDASDTATVRLDGKFVDVNDLCGKISLSSKTGDVDFGGGAGTDCSAPGSGGAGNTHSARNAFYHVTHANRRAAEYFPNLPWLKTAVTVRTNFLAQSGNWRECNAWWNGTTITTVRSTAGKCTNTGESPETLVHEWGHGMDQNAGGDTPDPGSGEASSDTFAMLQFRDACMSDNARGSSCFNCRAACTGVRDLAAFAQGGISTIARPSTVEDNQGIDCDRWTCPYYTSDGYPYQGPMGYEGHCEGYIAGTTDWDLAEALREKYGEETGSKRMEKLWFESLPSLKSAYRLGAQATQCDPSANVDGCAADNWYTVFLGTDDDDASRTNGTPNGWLVWDAFRAHRIECGNRPVEHWWSVPGVGSEGQGAGMDIGQVGAGDRPDMVLAVHGPAASPGKFRYQIGYELDEDGIAGKWGNVIEVQGRSGNVSGAAAAFARLNDKSEPELILVTYARIPGENHFYYTVGRDLGAGGVATSWSNFFEVPGLGSDDVQGLGAAVAQIDDDAGGRPELILMGYVNPVGMNSFRYRIGWNVDATGRATSWSQWAEIPGVGYEAQGAGVAIAHLDANPRPDMILMAYDNPSQMNGFRYKIGWDLNLQGNTQAWKDQPDRPGVGWEAQGADIAVRDLDGDSSPEIVFMAYDNPPGPNTFRLRTWHW